MQNIQSISKKQQTNMLNMLYFHKRRVIIGLLFGSGYVYFCKSTTNHPSEAIRLGVAGSIANMLCETIFHIVDTVNIRSKVADSKSPQGGTYQQVRAIYKKEGVFGFGRGFSACLYGSIFCGFTYFALYKAIKMHINEKYGKEVNPALVFFLASFVSECLTILVHFPYDLVKCRLQSKNYIFKYKNLPHAFQKEIMNNGILSLYTGAFPFLLTYASFVCIQFTLYEYIMGHYKKKLGEKEFKEK